MYARIGDKVLKLIAKVGTQSFSEACGCEWYCTNEQALRFETRVMFVREPHERLRSCYQFFVGLRDSGTTYDGFDYAILNSWETFVDYVLSGAADEHWTTQHSQATLDDKLTANHLLKFDYVEQWFPEFFKIRLSHINSSEPISVDDAYRRAEINAYYQEDIELYSAARDWGGESWPLP